MLALKVFAHALRFFKEHCLQELSDQSSTRIVNEDIRWVITVPAIWRQPAKQFMRQAAYEVRVQFVLYLCLLAVTGKSGHKNLHCTTPYSLLEASEIAMIMICVISLKAVYYVECQLCHGTNWYYL